jgi:hypothetical protein
MTNGMPIRRIICCTPRLMRSESWRTSSARAEALLDEFEHDIRAAFLRPDLSAVMNDCEKYVRRFRALSEEEEYRCISVFLHTAVSGN